MNYDNIANTDTDPSMCYYNPGCTNEAYTEYSTYINANDEKNVAAAAKNRVIVSFLFKSKIDLKS